MNGLLAELKHEYEDHAPWHYTEFGTICSCGRAVDFNEECKLQVKIRELIEEFDEEQEPTPVEKSPKKSWSGTWD